MAKTRTFVAIESDRTIRRKANGVIDQLRPYAKRAKWVDDGGLHMTLFFLGDLTDAEIAEVCGRTKATAREHRPFAMRVAGVGAFPAIERPRALWLGVAEGDESVRRLQADLEESLADLAQRGENRSFVPHWTLARLGKREDVSPELPEIVASLNDHEVAEVGVTEVVVMASELGPERPEYYVLARCQLG